MAANQIPQCRPGLRLADPLPGPGAASPTRSSEQFAAGAKALKVGNGLDADTEMGPLANDRRIPALEP